MTTTETQMTVTVGRMVYKVEAVTNSVGEKVWFLHGRRGACYGLMRNANRPEMLFAIQAKPGKFGIPSVLEGLWFTDKNGVVEFVGRW